MATMTDATLADCGELLADMRTVYACPADANSVREAQAAFTALGDAYTKQREALAKSLRGKHSIDWGMFENSSVCSSPCGKRTTLSSLLFSLCEDS